MPHQEELACEMKPPEEGVEAVQPARRALNFVGTRFTMFRDVLELRKNEQLNHA